MQRSKEEQSKLFWRFARGYMEKYGDIALIGYENTKSSIPSHEKQCFNFNTPQGCRFGKKCQFRHGEPLHPIPKEETSAEKKQ